MKVSLNTVKQYINIDLPPVDELVALINQQLGGVEEVIDLRAIYKDAKIVKVVECDKHPNADKLSFCQVDAGTGELVQVVCGASNVTADMWAVWLPPKSTVPSTYHDDEPFVLGARELRGVVSHGMLASAKELALGDDHNGIVDITERDLPKGKTLSPGISFAEVFGLDDAIIDIENKMFTHRPDLFGQLGVAREISAILHGASDGAEGEETRFVNPDWYSNAPGFVEGNGSLELEVFNDTPIGAPRFMAVAIDGVKVEPSPLWLQAELVRWGSKSINNIVDWTNYIMLLTAQPVHAYDYDKIRGAKIGVRMAKDGERITLLNGKTYQLTIDDIVIADGEGAIGLAGIMGGGNSEVSDATTRIVLEVANFDMYTVRKSSMRHGIFTDALTRFNKGQSPLQNDRVMRRLIDLVGGVQACTMFDLPANNWQDSVHGEVIVSPEFINERLGLGLNESQISNLLRRVNMAVNPIGEDTTQLSVTAPYWRTDIELPEDVVEEVGRLYGFDKLPRELPLRTIRPVVKNPLRACRKNIRENLTRAGANEVLTYTFVHEVVIKRAGQDSSHAFRLSNALSPDLQYYRLSLTPSLLDKVHMNQKAGHDKFALFELGKTHFKGDMDTAEPNIPNERNHIALVVAYSDKQRPAGAPYFVAKRYLAEVTGLDGLTLVKLTDHDLSGDDYSKQLVATFDPNRSSAIVHDGKLCGVVGEYKQAVKVAFKLPEYTAGLELSLGAVSSTKREYQPLSRYPSVWQDLSLRVASSVSYSSLAQTVSSAINSRADDATISIEPIAIYQPEGDDSTQTITYRITATSHSRTLTDDDLRAILDHAVEQSAANHSASVV